LLEVGWPNISRLDQDRGYYKRGNISSFLSIPREIQCDVVSKLYYPHDVENMEQIMMFWFELKVGIIRKLVGHTWTELQHCISPICDPCQ
jgi:hypothetical protein